MEALSPFFGTLCFGSVPVLRLGSEGGLAKDWPLLRARLMASCFSWFRFISQTAHGPCSCSRSLTSMVDRPWTRRFSLRNADRSLESYRIRKKAADIRLHLKTGIWLRCWKYLLFHSCTIYNLHFIKPNKIIDPLQASVEDIITKLICFVWYKNSLRSKFR